MGKLRVSHTVIAKTLVIVALIPITLEIGFRILPQLIPLDACRSSEVLATGYCQWWYTYDRPMQLGYTYKPGYRYKGPFNPADPAVIGADKLTCSRPRDDTFTLVLNADENGFLNEMPLQDRYDIVMTGDSFSQPFSPVFWYDELARLTGMSTLNLGMDGWGTLSEVEAIRHYGLEKNPKWLTLLYFEGNDLYNVEEYLKREGTGLDWRQYNLLPFNTLERMVTPHIFRYWTGAVPDPDWQPQQCIYPMTVATKANRFETVFFNIHINMLAENRDQIMANPAWDAATYAILELRQEVESQGGRFLLIYVPAKEHITWELIWDSEEINNFIAQAYPLRSFNEYDAHIHDQMNLMESFARANNVEFLNLYWNYREATLSGLELYNYADVHWNAAGSQMAARLVASYIKEHP